MKPNYICIGSQKGGTNSLKRYLNFHPEICMLRREMHFFDRSLDKGPLTKKNILNYEKSFKTNKLIVGEKTPSYNHLRYAIDRIYKYDKNMKLIILLREPVSRAFSQYNMFYGKKKQTDDEIMDYFKKQTNLKLKNLESLRGNSDNVIRGYYDEILKYILSKFPRKNIYIGISEEIKKDKLKYYNEIYQFLGAKKLKKIKTDLDVHARSYRKPIPKSVEKYLADIYKPHNEKLYKILGRKINIWENYYKQIDVNKS